MGILVYKQRFENPNKIKTPKSNYFYIRYIATRDGVATDNNLNHGLWGKMNSYDDLEDFNDWQSIAVEVKNASYRKTNIYKSILSFDRETADKLGLVNIEDWKSYVESHMLTIAKDNNIKFKNLSWACAFHDEETHPHVHIVFWDKNQRIMKNFVSPESVSNLRNKIIQKTFKEELLEYYKIKDESYKSIGYITRDMIKRFEDDTSKNIVTKFFSKFMIDEEDQKYRNLVNNMSNRDIKKLTKEYEEFFKIMREKNPKGSLKYKYLDPDLKELTKDLAKKFINEVADIRSMYNTHMSTNLEILKLYRKTEDETPLTEEMKKIDEKITIRVANAILDEYRKIIKVDQYKNNEYNNFSILKSTAVSIMLELENTRKNDNINLSTAKLKAYSKDLSKQAKKDIAKKMRDKGMEK